MEAWTGFDDVVVVDACQGAGAPGSVHRFDALELDRPDAAQLCQHASTHGFGVQAAVALARALGTLPCRLVIVAIEGGHFGDGELTSAEVDHAVADVVALLVQYE